MRYTQRQYAVAAKAILWYMASITIIAGFLLAANMGKANKIDKLNNEIMNLKTCGLDVIVCEGEEEPKSVSTTKASWYDYELDGVNWSKTHRTAASREFARGTLVEVTNKTNGKSVTVMINDYGPDENVHPDRALDLSSYAFSMIADTKLGVIDVDYREVGTDTYYGKK